ncbi:MAG: SDR family oxidoreductase [Treponema sp.]|jgi:NAD(P)-dependent dehydrogenase (short-subunit alcohol dehydrogenase family)|nr:SDR family oxidoreductase [Treponema sp.]
MRVFITGANRGFALLLSEYMAEKGHRVYACYHPSLPHEETDNAAAKYSGLTVIPADVTREDAVARAAKTILNDGGKLDAVVSVAGVLTDSDRELPITGVNIGDLRLALDVNVTGAAIVIKHFHGAVKAGGIFITLTSEGGSMTNVGTRYPAYSVSKSAENKLVAVFAKTVSDYRIYAVHPGRMNTVMGRNDAQIEPEESVHNIYRIITGEKTVPPENGWFINYLGQAMEI